MPDSAVAIPSLACPRLPPFDPGDLERVRPAFQEAPGCALRQFWLPAPEPQFAPGFVRVGWRNDLLLVFASLRDADIHTAATGLNQRLWTLGDCFEMFLQPANSPSYVEFHVAPNNQRLQLRFPDSDALARVQASNSLEELFLPGEAFRSWTWARPEDNCWLVYAEVPSQSVGGTPTSLDGASWRFSFSRYDYTRGTPEPVISSSSPHAIAAFHRRHEWGSLRFV